MILSIHRATRLIGVPAWLSIPGWRVASVAAPDAAVFRQSLPVAKLVLKHQGLL